jgi:ABC-type dipeptide/oligopeptide/nickel transport system permease subunit
VSAPSARHVVLHRLARNRLSASGVAIVVLLTLCVLLGPLVWRVDPLAQDLLDRVAAPSAAHPFGTDLQGRDVLSRMLYGGRISLLIAVSSVLLALGVGGGLGLLSGYRRGVLDEVVMRIMDVLLSFPALLLALLIAASAGPGIGNTVLAISVPAVPRFARLMRAMVLSVRERDYVLAARASGIRERGILTRHVLRNSVTPVVIQASVGVGIALLEVAGLGYLGVGVPPPTPEWGAILRDAQTFLIQRPVLLLIPGAVISLAILGFNLLGDALRDVLDTGR